MDIFETQRKVLMLEGLYAQYVGLFNNTKNKTTRKRIATYIITFLLAYAALNILSFARFLAPEGSFLKSDFFNFLSVFSFLSHLVIPILFIVFLVVLVKRERARMFSPREIARTRKKRANEVNSLEANMTAIQKELRMSELPQKYHYSFAVNWMVDAIYSKRVSTLSEVINAYEQYLNEERRHNAQLEAIRNIQVINYYYY